nr:hypothetical protein [Tanacetum cinerariifolium]
MDIDTDENSDDDNHEDLDVQKKFDEFDDEIECESKIEDLKEKRDDIWATFPTQEEAMNYGKELVGIHIFSYHDYVSGQRRFLVSTYKEFWR